MNAAHGHPTFPQGARRAADRSSTVHARDLDAFGDQYSADVAFVAALQGLRASGGLWRLREAERRMDGVRPGAGRELGRQRAMHAVSELYWRGEVWVPACQFNMSSGRLRPELRRFSQRRGMDLAASDAVAWLGTASAPGSAVTPGELWLRDPRAFARLLEARTWPCLPLLQAAA